jgi:hypothetical protein
MSDELGRRIAVARMRRSLCVVTVLRRCTGNFQLRRARIFCQSSALVDICLQASRGASSLSELCLRLMVVEFQHRSGAGVRSLVRDRLMARLVWGTASTANHGSPTGEGATVL